MKTTSELHEWTSETYHHPEDTIIAYSPMVPIRIRNVELLDADKDLNITMVQVANVILAMFSKDIPVCLPTYKITIFVGPIPKKSKTGNWGLSMPVIRSPFRVRLTADTVLD